MASAKPRLAPAPSPPFSQHLFTFSHTLALAQDMSFREDTFHYFFVHEPSSNRGPFNRQWDYLACCRLEDRPRRARSPVQRPLRRARPEVWDGGFLYGYGYG